MKTPPQLAVSALFAGFAGPVAVHGKRLHLGVMSFVTDHSDVTLREIKAYASKSKS